MHSHHIRVLLWLESTMVNYYLLALRSGTIIIHIIGTKFRYHHDSHLVTLALSSGTAITPNHHWHCFQTNPKSSLATTTLHCEQYCLHCSSLSFSFLFSFFVSFTWTVFPKFQDQNTISIVTYIFQDIPRHIFVLLKGELLPQNINYRSLSTKLYHLIGDWSV